MRDGWGQIAKTAKRLSQPKTMLFPERHQQVTRKRDFSGFENESSAYADCGLRLEKRLVGMPFEVVTGVIISLKERAVCLNAFQLPQGEWSS
jgi:hypothetical protein